MSDDLGQVPPQNLEAEQATLGGLMLGPSPGSAERVLSLLSPADFYRDFHRVVFAAIVRLVDAGTPADLVTVAEDLRSRGHLDPDGAVAYLCLLAEAVPTPANVEYYAGIVKDHAERRRVIDLGRRLIRAAFEGTDAMAAAREEATAALSEPAPTVEVPTDPKTRLSEIVGEALVREEEIDALGITTGFPRLDAATNGLRPGQPWLICARPGVGKTSLACSIIQHIARHHSVLFVSLEQTVDELWARLLGMTANIPGKRITNGCLSPAEKSRLSSAYERLSEWPITLDYAPSLTAPQLHLRVRQAVREGRADVVFVDHVGLLDKGGPATKYDRMTTVSNRLKEMAGECQVPVVQLCQINRSGEKLADKRPSLDLLRDTGAHEENAHCVIGIFRAECYEREDKSPPNEPQAAELLVLKAREGETGLHRVFYVPARTFFYEANGGF